MKQISGFVVLSSKEVLSLASQKEAEIHEWYNSLRTVIKNKHLMYKSLPWAARFFKRFIIGDAYTEEREEIDLFWLNHNYKEKLDLLNSIRMSASSASEIVLSIKDHNWFTTYYKE